MVDIPSPGNDDAMRAIELVAAELCGAVELAKVRRSDKAEGAEKAAPRRRSRRAVMARAGGQEEAAPAMEPSTPPAEAPTSPPAETTAEAPEEPPAAAAGAAEQQAPGKPAPEGEQPPPAP
jgi:hypothetical protein